MSFFELLDGLLTELDIPFYEGQPEFERSPPEEFITYDVYDVPNLRGDGKEKTTQYYATLSVFVTGTGRKARADRIVRDLSALLLDNDFIRQGGSYSSTDDFPRYYRRVTEFVYDYDNEEGEI